MNSKIALLACALIAFATNVTAKTPTGQNRTSLTNKNIKYKVVKDHFVVLKRAGITAVIVGQRSRLTTNGFQGTEPATTDLPRSNIKNARKIYSSLATQELISNIFMMELWLASRRNLNLEKILCSYGKSILTQLSFINHQQKTGNWKVVEGTKSLKMELLNTRLSVFRVKSPSKKNRSACSGQATSMHQKTSPFGSKESIPN